MRMTFDKDPPNTEKLGAAVMRIMKSKDPKASAGASPQTTPVVKADAVGPAPDPLDKLIDYSRRGGLFNYLSDLLSEKKKDEFAKVTPEQAQKLLNDMKGLEIGTDISMDDYFEKRQQLSRIVGKK